MPKENILFLDDSRIVLDFYADAIELFGEKFGHKKLGLIPSLKALGNMADPEERPTLALVDVNFPNPEDGEKAVKELRRRFPGIYIVACSTTNVTWADCQWDKSQFLMKSDLINNITKLQH